MQSNKTVLQQAIAGLLRCAFSLSNQTEEIQGVP